MGRPAEERWGCRRLDGQAGSARPRARLAQNLLAACACHAGLLLLVPASGAVMLPAAEPAVPLVFASLPPPAAPAVSAPPLAAEPAPVPPTAAIPAPAPEPSTPPPAMPAPDALASVTPPTPDSPPAPDPLPTQAAPPSQAAEVTPAAPPVPRARPVHHAAPPRRETVPHATPAPPAAEPPAAQAAAPANPAQDTSQAAASAAQASFEGRLLQIIQAQARRNYPAAARMMGMTGQAVISFQYHDGKVRVMGLARSSGSAALDRAALAAVQNAAMPPPPPDLAGKTLSDLVHVEYDLDAS